MQISLMTFFASLFGNGGRFWLYNYVLFFIVRLSGLRIAGDAISPVKHLYLAASSGDREKDLSKLRRIVAKVREKPFAMMTSLWNFLWNEPLWLVACCSSSQLAVSQLQYKVRWLYKIFVSIQWYEDMIIQCMMSSYWSSLAYWLHRLI